jgi:histidinol-phosphatase (PHP family)
MLPNNPHKADYHVHPGYSLDATGTVDQYCRRALELGIEEICFTTHYDSDPHRKDIDPFVQIDGQTVPLSEESVRRYIDDVRRAGERYRPSGLAVRVGLEVDFAPHIEERLRRELTKFDLDYRLGAVHCLDHIAISASDEAEKYFRTKSAGEMLSAYYGVLRRAVQSGLFEVMAHLDIYKKYGLGFYGEEILAGHKGLVEPVLELMAENEVGIEINTGVLRKGHKEFCPALEVVKLALEKGVKIVAYGSDAHKVDQLGEGIQEAYVAVEELKRKIGLKSKTATK